MRIVTASEFIALKKGTVFAKNDGHTFDELCVKEESIEDIDFFYTRLVDVVYADNCNAYDVKMENARSRETDTDYNSICRDGIFDRDQMYAVYSNSDVTDLINKLKGTLG